MASMISIYAFTSSVILWQLCTTSLACPLLQVCTCVAKSVTCIGSKTSKIKDAGLRQILIGLPQGTEQLIIESANLPNLTKEFFSTVKGNVETLKHFSVISSNITTIEASAFENFIKLEYLDLSDNNIVPDNYAFQDLTQLKTLKLRKAFKENKNFTLPEKFFHHVKKLENLDLSMNGIRDVSLGLFKDACANLRNLDLSGNQIHRLQDDVFQYCPQLVNLTINDSFIDHLDNHTFRGLKMLKYLNLERNNLHILLIPNIEPLKNVTIHLDNNPWTCDCDFIYLMKWLKQQKINLNLKCKWPLKLSDKTLLSLNVYDLGCEDPKVTRVSKNPMTIFEGKNGTYVIEAIGLPYVDVNCTHTKKDANKKLSVSYKHSIDTDTNNHYTNIRIDFTNLKVSDSGNVTCTVKNLLGKTKLWFALQVQKDNHGQRIDIVLFVSGILVFVIVVALLIACLNLRNKKQADKEAKAKKLSEHRSNKDHDNKAFEENVKSKYRRKDSIGYFPSSGPMKTALTPNEG